jgi:hypothetical protein
MQFLIVDAAITAMKELLNALLDISKIDAAATCATCQGSGGECQNDDRY